MNEFVSTLTFENYLVTELTYKQNRNYDFDSDVLNVDFDISAKVQLTTEKDSAVTIQVVCGNEEDSDCPFIIQVEVIGIFKFEGELDKFEKLVTTNAIAILFPYVRSLISDLSGKSNVYPQYNLPLINVVKFIKNNDKLEIIKPE